jgi:hypothetical protein
MRTVLTNPFAPGSGAIPTVWIGREDELADVDRRLVPRRAARLFERGRTYLGDPGLGKSVLVNRIAADRQAAGDLVSAPLRLARGRDPLSALAAAVAPLATTGDRVGEQLGDALARVTAVGLLGATVEVAAREEDRYAGVVELLTAVAQHAASRDRLLVVRVDEVQNLSGDPLSQLLTVLGDLLESTTTITDAAGAPAERFDPVVVLLSGLPSFAARAADAGATFARRFATTYLRPFTDEEVRAGLVYAFDDGFEVLGEDGPTSVHLADAAREAIVDRCLGDPFLFQLAGAAAWDAGTGSVITADEVEQGWTRARREVDAHLRSKLQGITELQLTTLTAAARAGGDDPVDGTTIARAMGRSSSEQIGSTLQALVAKQALALVPGGYRVVSRPLARLLVDDSA